MNDVAGNFKYNTNDARIIKEVLKYESTPQAIIEFSKYCEHLTDYSYWFVLSTLWVSYTGFSDLNLWREFFSSNRPRREISIMKPSERKEFKQLPYFIRVYRAHRPNEKDWIAYTTKLETAFRFARERGVETITEYQIKKRDVIGYFTRRGENEIILLDPTKVKFIQDHSVPEEKGLFIGQRSDQTPFILKNGKWTMIRFNELKANDVFRLYEESGQLISDKHGNTEFTAISDSSLKEGNWQIQIDFQIKQ